jgi:hypothetical protein
MSYARKDYADFKTASAEFSGKELADLSSAVALINVSNNFGVAHQRARWRVRHGESAGGQQRRFPG